MRKRQRQAGLENMHTSYILSVSITNGIASEASSSLVDAPGMGDAEINVRSVFGPRLNSGVKNVNKYARRRQVSCLL
jgi:hypothetical protein